MEPLAISKKIIEFQKISFDNVYETFARMQDQAYSTMSENLAKIPNLPNQGADACKVWMDSAKQGRQTFKDAIDESFKAWTALTDKSEPSVNENA